MIERPVAPPKFSCAVCSRLQTVVMGDRGPVKVALDITRIGNFLFCSECLARSKQTSDPDGYERVTMLDGPMKGNAWLTSFDEGRVA